MAILVEWERFVSSVPESQQEYRTIEIFHPDLSQVFRFVNKFNDINLTLESTAPRNPGASVLFTAAGLQIVEPAERQDSEQSLSVNFANVDGTIHDIADQISGIGYFTPIEIVYRKYYSGDLSEPVTSPLYLFASSLSFDGVTAVSFAAEDADLSQKRSGSLYTSEQFPGLKE